MAASVYVYAGPQIHLGSINIWLAEALLVGTVLLAALVDPRRGLPLRQGFIEIAMLFVCLGVVVGCLVAVRDGVPLLSALQDARNAAFFASFLPAVIAFRTLHGRSAVLLTASIMAVVTVVLQVIQLGLGSGTSIFDSGSYANMVGMEALTGVVRVRPPGLTLVYIVAAFAACYLLFGPKRHWALAAGMLGTCLIGLVISQNRNMLIGLPFGLLVAAAMSRRPSKAIVIGTILAAVVVVLVALAPALATSPTTEGRLASRVTSLADLQEVDQTSLSDRTYENTHAFAVLKRSPLLGIGWGSSYGASYLGAPRLWIHNGYLWLWMRMGLAFAILFILVLVAALRSGVRWQRGANKQAAWVGSGLIAALVAVMSSAMVGSYFSEPNSLLFLMGLVALAASLDDAARRGLRTPPTTGLSEGEH